MNKIFGFAFLFLLINISKAQQIKVCQLPSTATTRQNDYLIKEDSTCTITNKIKVKDFFLANPYNDKTVTLTSGNGIGITSAYPNFTITNTSPLSNLHANSPLSFSNNTVSITQANGSTNGYISSTDWNIFNNKQNALTFPLSISNGGTGANSASVALNNLLPSQASNAGKILQTDGSNASWINYTSGWGLNGNSNTAYGNFLGTTNNRPLVFKTNDTTKFVIDSLGYKLHFGPNKCNTPPNWNACFETYITAGYDHAVIQSTSYGEGSLSLMPLGNGIGIGSNFIINSGTVPFTPKASVHIKPILTDGNSSSTGFRVDNAKWYNTDANWEDQAFKIVCNAYGDNGETSIIAYNRLEETKGDTTFINIYNATTGAWVNLGRKGNYFVVAIPTAHPTYSIVGAFGTKNWTIGSKVTIHFNNNIKLLNKAVVDGQYFSRLVLANNEDYTVQKDVVMQFILSTNGWVETSRNDLNAPIIPISQTLDGVATVTLTNGGIYNIPSGTQLLINRSSNGLLEDDAGATAVSNPTLNLDNIFNATTPAKVFEFRTYVNISNVYITSSYYDIKNGQTVNQNIISLTAGQTFRLMLIRNSNTIIRIN